MTELQQMLFNTLEPKNISQYKERLSLNLDSYKDKGYLTHNFHPFPAKFVPQIPRELIARYSSPNEVILDPFCGSGTTLVEASILKRKAVGLDINPIACLVSRVKTSTLESHEYAAIEKILKQAQALLLAIKTEGADFSRVQIPNFRNQDHWFPFHVQVELAALRGIIYKCKISRVQDFLNVAFSSIIVKVSNQESETRWVAVEKDIQPGFPVECFLFKANEMIKRSRQYKVLEPSSSVIYEQSAIDPIPLADGFIDFAVTSPPYLNSFDYYLYHKLRFFWLGFDHYRVQSGEIGSRNKHSDNGEGIETYCANISMVAAEVFRVLKPGGKFCVIIGDSILRGELINMKVVYYELGKNAGFDIEDTFSYDQRKYTTAFTRNLKTLPKQTHVICFGKPG